MSKAKQKRTLTLCPHCERVLDGWIFPQNGDMYIRSECPEHGQNQSLYFKDASLYRKLEKIVDKKSMCRDLRCAKGLPCHRHIEKTYNIMIDVTLRCNMDCPVCLADAEKNAGYPEPTANEIFERLPQKQQGQPMSVVFIGGEPTLRKDLPELIRGVIKLGHIPRVATNGLKLESLEYAQSLADAGLHWIILQFDGLDDATNMKIRGKPLLDRKIKILDNCQKAGIAVQLSMMVEPGRNGHQVGRMIEFAFAHPAVRWTNYYPLSLINRCNFESDHGLQVADMLGIFEKQTGGKLTADDFLGMMKIFRRLYALTGKEVLRQKLSTYPMVLVKTGDRYVPLPRLLSPSGLLAHPGAMWAFLKSLPKLLTFQQMDMPDNILFLTMEKFHNRQSVDLCEASCCHMSYMIRDGFVVFDVYNFLYREKENW